MRRARTARLYFAAAAAVAALAFAWGTVMTAAAQPASATIDRLQRLPALSPLEVFQIAKQARDRAVAEGTGDLPPLLVHLSNGQTVPVFLADLRERQGRSTQLALIVRREGRAAPLDMLYVELDQVTAVTLQDAGVWADLASGGRVAPTDAGGAVPAKLEIGSRIAAFGGTLSPLVGRQIALEPQMEGFPADEERRAILFAGVQTLERELRRIATDALGRAALQSVDRITVAAGPLAAQKRGTRLEVSLPLDRIADGASLRRALEAAL